jgi:hypothetical protein
MDTLSFINAILQVQSSKTSYVYIIKGDNDDLEIIRQRSKPSKLIPPKAKD